MCQFPQQLTNLWWDEDHFSNDQSKQVGRWVGKLSKEPKKPNNNLDSSFSPQKNLMKKRMTTLETWEIWQMISNERKERKTNKPITVDER
jgi:hypothetical protein